MTVKSGVRSGAGSAMRIARTVKVKSPTRIRIDAAVQEISNFSLPAICLGSLSPSFRRNRTMHSSTSADTITRITAQTNSVTTNNRASASAWGEAGLSTGSNTAKKQPLFGKINSIPKHGSFRDPVVVNLAYRGALFLGNLNAREIRLRF